MLDLNYYTFIIIIRNVNDIFFLLGINFVQFLPLKIIVTSQMTPSYRIFHKTSSGAGVVAPLEQTLQAGEQST